MVHPNGIRMPHSLHGAEVERYSRQLLLPQFGVESQENLKNAKILIIGVGGLGCPASIYLSGAGVGKIGLVDRPNDVVEKSNLHRQMAHTEARVGMSKVESAEIALRALNSDIEIVKHKSFEQHNALQIVSMYDLVLDCTDNVMSRYLISDACAANNVPLVSGAAIGMEGQLTVYCASELCPCYRCVFPQPPPPSCVGSCDSAGVLGPVPGIIGTLQALEALKLVGKVRQCESLERKMLLFDGAESTFRTVKLRSRMKDCIACGESRIDVPTFDYRLFTLGDVEQAGSAWPVLQPKYRLSPRQFAELRSIDRTYRLIDVRPQAEYRMCHLEEAENFPIDGLGAERASALVAEERRLIFICRRGNASRKAVECCLKIGTSQVHDVVGGLQAWHSQIDPEFPLY